MSMDESATQKFLSLDGRFRHIMVLSRVYVPFSR